MDTHAMEDLDLVIDSPLWVQNDGSLSEAALEALILRAVAETFAFTRTPPAPLCLLLTDDARIKALNAQFRGKNTPTNVLSFPALPPPKSAPTNASTPKSPRPPAPPAPLGDLAIAFETTAAEAQAEGKSLAAHLSHLVVHGVLHLLGRDHETSEQDAENMENEERIILSALGFPDPYSDAETTINTLQYNDNVHGTDLSCAPQGAPHATR